MADDALRTHLVRALTWQDAHAGFEMVVKDLAPSLRGVRPAGLPYSPWEILEHLRITQFDILDFCRNPAYAERPWPDDYWPGEPEPPTETAWDESIDGYARDRKALIALAEDANLDLFGEIPHGSGQSYLRELLLVADHNAYHVGELIVVRRLLGAWPPA